MKDILFQFPNIPEVFCLFQGIPENRPPDGKAWGDPDEREKLKGELLGNYASLDLREIRACHQVHGTDILLEPPLLGELSDAEKADGMCADRPGAALLIKTADCQPILFAHKSGKYIMAIHAGWRGNRAHFPLLAVEFFCKTYGLQPVDIFAVRGPSLCPKCSEFINYDEEWGPEFDAWHNAALKKVDLWAMTRDQLAWAGLPESQIFGVDLCTAENPEKFFSYRKNRNCGRQASLVWIAAD